MVLLFRRRRLGPEHQYDHYRYNPAGQITYEGDSTASDAYSYTPAGELASVTEDCVGAPASR